MKLRQKRITSAIALFLVFSTTQVYVGLTFAAPQPITVRSEVAAPAPQQATGSLTTHDNKPITVNGAAASGGTTIISGASIETPDGVGGTVKLGSLGSLQIDPKTKLTMEFQKGSVKVMLLQGCVILRTRKGTSGEVDNPQGTIGTSSPARDGVIRTCPDRAPAAPVAPAAAAGGGLFGIGVGETISLLALATTIVAIPIIQRGRNPSPSTP
ncbi:MAG TPA: hypothetical protein VN920_16125 [Pyrinomonadaceae bacterium]|nr:hypothetical protein [Pyrinomonadaceae bacterium]